MNYVIAYTESVEIKRLRRKLLKKEIKIAAMEKYIAKLEREVALRTIELPRNLEKTVERALANVRLVPVLGIGSSDKII